MRVRWSTGQLAGMLVCTLMLGIAPMPAVAQSYKVSINPTLNGLDVAFAAQESERLLLVNVSNKTDKKIRCDFVYDAPPQSLHRSTIWVKPNLSGVSNLPINRTLFTVTVNVECREAAD